MPWILEHADDEPPVRWQCVVCEAGIGEPHEDGCNCTLMEGVEIEEWPDEIKQPST